jgi:hypothetical protein
VLVESSSPSLMSTIEMLLSSPPLTTLNSAYFRKVSAQFAVAGDVLRITSEADDIQRVDSGLMRPKVVDRLCKLTVPVGLSVCHSDILCEVPNRDPVIRQSIVVPIIVRSDHTHEPSVAPDTAIKRVPTRANFKLRRHRP